MKAKICGVKNEYILKYTTSHIYSPEFIGFIVNYPKSKRFVELNLLKKILKINKRKSKYVAVLVSPNFDFLEKIKNFNFDYYQIYDLEPKQIIEIKKKYKKKIISAITIGNKKDVNKYKNYKDFSDIILFDSKGYEKSLGFDHSFLNKVPNSINKMIAGNIKYNENLDKYLKIADIIDVSGSLETQGEKDILKIDTFLKKIKKTKDEN